MKNRGIETLVVAVVVLALLIAAAFGAMKVREGLQCLAARIECSK